MATRSPARSRSASSASRPATPPPAIKTRSGGRVELIGFLFRSVTQVWVRARRAGQPSRRSAHSCAGMSAANEARLRRTSSAERTPMTTPATTGWASGNAIAACGSVTPCASQTSAMRCARASSSRGAGYVVEARPFRGSWLGEHTGVEDRGRQHGDAAFGARGQQVVERELIEQRVATGQHHHVDVHLAHERGQLAGVVHARADRPHHALGAELGECGIPLEQRGEEMVLGIVQEEHVDPVDAHPRERLLEAAHGCPRARSPTRGGASRAPRRPVVPALRVLRDEQPADLRRQRERPARLLAQERPDQALGLPAP